MILFTMYDFDGYAGNGRKNPEKTYIHEKQGKNSPFGFPPIPPSIKLEADCFPGRKYRKQAGPTLGGAEYLWLTSGLFLLRNIVRSKLTQGTNSCPYAKHNVRLFLFFVAYSRT